MAVPPLSERISGIWNRPLTRRAVGGGIVLGAAGAVLAQNKGTVRLLVRAAEAASSLTDLSTKKDLKEVITVAANYEVQIVSASNSGDMAVLAKYPADSTQHLLKGEFDQNGNFALKEKLALPPTFKGLDAAISPTDPKVMVAVGTNNENNQGKFTFTLDGGGKWQSAILENGSPIYKAQVFPGTRKILVTSGDINAENYPLLYIFDVDTKQFTKVSQRGYVRTMYMTALTPNPSEQNKYTTYASADPHAGIVRMEFDTTTNTVTSQELYGQYPYASLITPWKESNGAEHLYFVNPNYDYYTIGGQIQRAVTIYDPIKGISFRAAVEKYANLVPSFGTKIYRADALHVDTALNLGFMGVNISYPVKNKSYSNYVSYIETFPLDDPTNYAKHEIIPLDGEWPQQTGNVSTHINSMKVVRKNGRVYLHASVYQQELIDNGETVYPVFKQGGLLTRDITNGINTSPWEKTLVTKDVFRISLPSIAVNASVPASR